MSATRRIGEFTKQFVPVVKLRVQCETCGHQAIIAAPCKGTRYPVLYCGECGDREPLIEPFRVHERPR